MLLSSSTIDNLLCEVMFSKTSLMIALGRNGLTHLKSCVSPGYRALRGIKEELNKWKKINFDSIGELLIQIDETINFYMHSFSLRDNILSQHSIHHSVFFSSFLLSDVSNL